MRTARSVAARFCLEIRGEAGRERATNGGHAQDRKFLVKAVRQVAGQAKPLTFPRPNSGRRRRGLRFVTAWRRGEARPIKAQFRVASAVKGLNNSYREVTCVPCVYRVRVRESRGDSRVGDPRRKRKDSPSSTVSSRRPFRARVRFASAAIIRLTAAGCFRKTFPIV